MIRLPTDRLIFRDWTAADLQAFHAICSDPAVMQFVNDGQTWPAERTKLWIEDSIQTARTHGYSKWALIFKETSELIGYCGYLPTETGPEIGWRLAKRFWGMGLATEAATAVLKHGFEILGFQRVIAQVNSGNRPSLRVCEKLGMKFDHSIDRNGRTVLVYAISRPATQ
jgi:RimJ/RimL family protein N-acetyltransferase